MRQIALSKSTLSRLPLYLKSVERARTETISATVIARDLHLGEVQVRKDLASISRLGRPKYGYPREALRDDIMQVLGINNRTEAVIVGAGRLGRALLEYDGFKEFGLVVMAAFDPGISSDIPTDGDMRVFPIQRLGWYCTNHDVHMGILTVPAESAQAACDQMIAAGITAILNFAPYRLNAPEYVTIQQEDVALSLAYLKQLQTPVQ